MLEVAHERTSIAVCKENRLNMSKNDIDVGIIFQQDELEELIEAIETARFISNMICFPTNQRNELNEAMEDWSSKSQARAIGEHLIVLREILDNETKKQD